MIIEIGYIYRECKDSDPIKSWTYYQTETNDFSEAVKKASVYFKKFIRDTGWSRKVKLTEIKMISHETDPIPVVCIDDPPKSTRKRTLKKTRSSPSPRTKKA